MYRIRCLRSESIDSYTAVRSDEMEVKRWPLWQKIAVISGIVVLSIALLIFLAIWVVFPLVFMNSISIQRFFMFMNTDNPKNPEFDHPEKYDMEGVVNFYITTKDVNDTKPISIGAWLILTDDEVPTTMISTMTNDTASRILKNTTKPILMYLHGVACNRILPVQTYKVVRKYFLIIALDHRGFGDSGPDVNPSETGIVSDTAQVYQWIRANTKNEIFVWGHSLGTALSTHTVRSLKENYNIVPMGLVLEAPFSTMRDEVTNNRIGVLFNWLAYFNSTILDPLESNGFRFKTTTNILFVDCPILIMHAEDDDVIPVKLGKRDFMSECRAENKAKN